MRQFQRLLRPRPVGGSTPQTDIVDQQQQRPYAHTSSRSGASLDQPVRDRLEARVGHSLDEVRIFSDSAAADAASAVNARAFTVGSEIHFGAGEFAPGSLSGQELLLHEATHAVQNARADANATLDPISTPTDAAEQEASRVAESPAAGPATISAAPSAVIACSPKEEPSSIANANTGIGIAGTGTGLFSQVMGALSGRGPGYGLAKEAGGSFGDVFGVLGGITGIGSGLDKLSKGGGADAALDIGKGALDTTGGAAGILGANPLIGAFTGAASAGIDIGRGVMKVSSDDLDVATEGAYDITGGIASGISSIGDATKNPFLMAGGRAASAGLTAGKYIVKGSDSISKDRGYFHDDYGNKQSGSSEAADWGRSVDDFFGDTPVLDEIGGVLGGATAIAGGIGNSAYTYGRRAVGAIGDGLSAIGDFFAGDDLTPQEIEMIKKKSPWLANMLD